MIVKIGSECRISKFKFSNKSKAAREKKFKSHYYQTIDKLKQKILAVIQVHGLHAS